MGKERTGVWGRRFRLFRGERRAVRFSADFGGGEFSFEALVEGQAVEVGGEAGSGEEEPREDEDEARGGAHRGDLSMRVRGRWASGNWAK
jgi:hypothetical protein